MLRHAAKERLPWRQALAVKRKPPLSLVSISETTCAATETPQRASVLELTGLTSLRPDGW